MITGVPLIVVACLAGLLIGSFLNVCVYRLPRDLSVVRPRSFCPGCEKMIAWYDNIPLLSFGLLRGRCRYCREFIPWRYPLVELSTAAAFGLCFAAYGLTGVGFKYAILSAILITLTASDMESRILPDEFTLGGTVVGLVFALFVPMDEYIITFFIPRVLRAALALAGGKRLRGARGRRLDLAGGILIREVSSSRRYGPRRRKDDHDDRCVPGLTLVAAHVDARVARGSVGELIHLKATQKARRHTNSRSGVFWDFPRSGFCCGRRFGRAARTLGM